MILIKQIGVYVNILNCKLKKHFADVFKRNGINLTGEQFLVMDTLWNEGTMTQQSIAYIIQKDKNSVTQFVDNLERKGLVRRMVDKKDRRVNNVMLTEEGERLKESTKAIAIDAMNKIFSGFSEQELMVFATVLQRACDNIPEGNA